MYTFALIANPFARILRTKKHLVSGLENLVKEGSGEFFFTSSTTELEKTLKYLCSKRVDVISILGGDGSINLVLSAMLKVYQNKKLPKILVLGGGTANVLALNLGIKHSPVRVMTDFINVNNSTKKMAEISIPALNIDSRLGFVFANGIATRFLEIFYGQKGHIAKAGLLMIRTAMGAIPIKKLSKIHNNESFFLELTKSFPMQVDEDPPHPWFRGNGSKEISMIYISTLPKMAFGIPWICQSKLVSEHMGMLVAGIEGREIIKEGLNLLRGHPIDNENVLIEKIKSVKIEMPLYPRYTIDGEIFDAPKKNVTIKLGEKFLFVTPYGT